MAKAFKSRPPFWRCPKSACNSDVFGVLSVYDSHYVRRCNICDFDQIIRLPTPRKRIVYLDQNAISLMVKARLGRAEKKWTELENLLKHAIQRQAICCPHSQAHETESRMDVALRDEYKKLFQNLSINTRLKSPHRVEINHVALALHAFDGGGSRSYWPRWRVVFPKNPHVWVPDMIISVNIGGEDEREARSRRVKQEVKARLDNINQSLKESTRTFEEHFASETRQNTLNVIEMYRRDMSAIEAATTPEARIQAFMTGSVYGDTMRFILHHYERENPGIKESMEKAGRFVWSQDFADMPHVRISSAIYAELTMQTQRGSTGFKASDMTDVEVISHYAPYCDAMFTDNAMRAILTGNPVKDKIRLDTKLFSSSNINDFFTFIEESIRAVPAMVAEKAIEVYGLPKK